MPDHGDMPNSSDIHAITLPDRGWMWMCCTHGSLGYELLEEQAIEHLRSHEHMWTDPDCIQATQGLLHAMGGNCPDHDWDTLNDMIATIRCHSSFSQLPDDFWDYTEDGEPSCDGVHDIIDRLMVSGCDSHVIHLPTAIETINEFPTEVVRCATRLSVPTVVAANIIATGNDSTWIGEQIADELLEWIARGE